MLAECPIDVELVRSVAKLVENLYQNQQHFVLVLESSCKSHHQLQLRMPVNSDRFLDMHR